MKTVLKLYVTGRSGQSQDAIANLRRICEQDLAGEYELEIIDIVEQPQRAAEEKILATPTLVREEPGPRRKLVGDLSKGEHVLRELQLQSKRHPEGAS